MKTAVIYARYSSERQTEQSIEGQLHVCNDYAKRNDLVIVGTYIDRAMTGTNDNREDFQRMLKDSDKKSFDYVLVYKLDRFSRNKYEMAIHRKHLKDNGVKILSAMENIPETPEGILLESFEWRYRSQAPEQKHMRNIHPLPQPHQTQNRRRDLPECCVWSPQETFLWIFSENCADLLPRSCPYESAVRRDRAIPRTNRQAKNR